MPKKVVVNDGIISGLESVLTLTIEEWDKLTGDSGGLVHGKLYDILGCVGVALSQTSLLIKSVKVKNKMGIIPTHDPKKCFIAEYW